jgi:RNA polymerase sigma factor (sigma-70 family)
VSGSELEQRLAAAMAAAQVGDAAAYQILLRACVPVIAAVARRKGIAPDRVDDVVQETLLTLHRARATYDPARPFLPWLHAIARRRAVDALRHHGRNRAREVYDPRTYASQSDAGPSAGDRLEQSDRAQRLAAAVATLPPGQREAVERLGLGEETLEEAAAQTGRSKTALKVNLHRALKALRSKLAGGAFDDV